MKRLNSSFCPGHFFENRTRINRIFTARKRSLGQGNIFYTCLSVILFTEGVLHCMVLLSVVDSNPQTAPTQTTRSLDSTPWTALSPEQHHHPLDSTTPPPDSTTPLPDSTIPHGDHPSQTAPSPTDITTP